MNKPHIRITFLPSLAALLLLAACGGGTGAKDFASSNPNTLAPSASSSTAKAANSSASADTTFPTQPDNVIQVSALSRQVDIRWSAASDNLSVVGYKIYRNGTLISTLDANTLSYSDPTTAPQVIYLYGVSAGDAAGNWSSPKLLSITTPAALIAGKVSLKWLPPTERENGHSLSTNEIGGYEVRYRNLAENSYHYLSAAKDQRQLDIDNLNGDYVFEIAAFDTDGLYSNFVSLAPY
jgi:hypothetical protein